MTLKVESKITIATIGVLAVTVAGGWFWISLHRQPTSTSALNADRDFLHGCIAVIAYIAGGISFWRSAVAALIVRTLVASLSCLAAFEAIRGCYSLWSVALGTDRSLAGIANPWVLFFGVALLAIYCIATFASALCIVPTHVLRRFGFFLQFGVLPLALVLVDVIALAPDRWLGFASFGYHLALALGFALLSMRMYDLRIQFQPSHERRSAALTGWQRNCLDPRVL